MEKKIAGVILILVSAYFAYRALQPANKITMSVITLPGNKYVFEPKIYERSTVFAMNSSDWLEAIVKNEGVDALCVAAIKLTVSYEINRNVEEPVYAVWGVSAGWDGHAGIWLTKSGATLTTISGQMRTGTTYTTTTGYFFTGLRYGRIKYTPGEMERPFLTSDIFATNPRINSSYFSHYLPTEEEYEGTVSQTESVNLNLRELLRVQGAPTETPISLAFCVTFVTESGLGKDLKSDDPEVLAMPFDSGSLVIFLDKVVEPPSIPPAIGGYSWPVQGLRHDVLETLKLPSYSIDPAVWAIGHLILLCGAVFLIFDRSHWWILCQFFIIPLGFVLLDYFFAWSVGRIILLFIAELAIALLASLATGD